MHLKPALFLDRDGTIIEERNYLKDPAQVKLLPGVTAALKKAQSRGWHLIIVSNQSGVARGYFSETEVTAVQQRVAQLLLQEGVRLTDFYYCPHHPAGKPPYNIDCHCRKPKTGMLEKARQAHDINISQSVMIGDKLSDMQTARNFKIPAVLVTTGYGAAEARKAGAGSTDFVADNLMAAVNWIERRRQNSATG